MKCNVRTDHKVGGAVQTREVFGQTKNGKVIQKSWMAAWMSRWRTTGSLPHPDSAHYQSRKKKFHIFFLELQVAEQRGGSGKVCENVGILAEITSSTMLTYIITALYQMNVTKEKHFTARFPLEHRG